MMAETPVLSISGARQVGKSTLMAQLLKDQPARIVNLDSQVARASAEADPDAFADQYPSGTLAIDEIQRVPKLFLSIKNALEKDRRPGRFVITGSSNLATLKGAEESLAGRAQTLHMRGLSQGERRGVCEDFPRFVWTLDKGAELREYPDYTRDDYLCMVQASGFPEVRDAAPRTLNRWLANYLDRVLTRDAQEVTGIQYPDRLRQLLEYIASLGTAEFVAAGISRAIDLPARTVPTYLDALASVYLVDVLPAWGTNLAKRAVSRPKVFLQDTGAAAYLAGVDAEAMSTDISSVLTGGLVESFVANELLKQSAWSTVDFRLFHFRDRAGREVDLVMENRRRDVVGIEVKATSTVKASHFKGLEYLRDQAGDRFRAGVVLYTGQAALPFGDRLWALPMASLWDHEVA